MIVDFDKVMENYANGVSTNSSLASLGFTENNDNYCNSMLTYLLYKMKDIFNYKSIGADIKDNIKALYNYIIPSEETNIKFKTNGTI